MSQCRKTVARIKSFFSNPLYWAIGILIFVGILLGFSGFPNNYLGDDLRVHLLAGDIEMIFHFS